MNYDYKVTYRYGRNRTDFFHDRDQLIRFYAKEGTKLKNIARINIPGQGDKGRLEAGDERFDSIMREVELMGRIVMLEGRVAELEYKLNQVKAQAGESVAPQP